ncbi:hypothetical protein [Microbacterium sp. AK031]|uniref:hypothetical protein n=1 Tax=Microbacterium sp. AK031 TaxID=2723076 RepID=UPI002169A98B|nr:hypothetical protein [Microbacterium sp. AK031]MCS3844603.1 DNA-binding transcriptional LysR family regulator [Microbacterium sp. AK031]
MSALNPWPATSCAEGDPISDVMIATPVETYDRLRTGADLAVTTSPPASRLRGTRVMTLPLFCQLPATHPLVATHVPDLCPEGTYPA